MVAELAANRRNEQGWSDVGAVVGATHPAEAESLRERMPGVILLVPGIGAQGGKVSDCAPLCGPDGYGAVLTASRSVIYPEGQSGDWMQSIAEAAARLADETGRVAGLR
jgi:orotidine-5'-phosphate decarboxylase